MPNKTEEYLALACKTADSFSRQWEHWAEFLITAARLYKYSYAQYMMAFNRNFGGSSGGGGGGGNLNNNGGGGGDGSGCGCLIAIAVVVVLILIVLGG